MRQMRSSNRSLASSCSSASPKSLVVRPVGRRSSALKRASPGIAAAVHDGPGALTQAQVDQFHEQGFLALPGFASAEEVKALRQRVAELLQGFDPDKQRREVFSTTDQTQTSASASCSSSWVPTQARYTSNYFYESAANISYFLEEKAFTEDGKLRQSKDLSVNKIGHAMHDLDPVFRAFSRSEKVAGVLKSLGYKRPLPVQSMYIFKNANIGGAVVPHQDSSFIYTEPLSCVGLWWALDTATKDNGCLWAAPGEHRKGLRRRFFVNKENAVQFDAPAPEYDLSSFTPVECSPGTLVLLHGENVHYSAENTSPISRHSYSMHFVEGTSEFKWPADNWAHRPESMPWEPLYG